MATGRYGEPITEAEAAALADEERAELSFASGEYDSRGEEPGLRGDTIITTEVNIDAYGELLRVAEIARDIHQRWLASRPVDDQLRELGKALWVQDRRAAGDSIPQRRDPDGTGAQTHDERGVRIGFMDDDPMGWER